MPSKLTAYPAPIVSQLGKPWKGPTKPGPVCLFVIRRPEVQKEHPSAGALDSYGHEVYKPQSFHQGLVLLSDSIENPSLHRHLKHVQRNCSKRLRSPAASCALNNGPVDSERSSSASTLRLGSNPFSRTAIP